MSGGNAYLGGPSDEAAEAYANESNVAFNAEMLALLDEDKLYEPLAAAIISEIDYGNPYKEDVAGNLAVAAIRALRELLMRPARDDRPCLTGQRDHSASLTDRIAKERRENHE